MSWQFSLPLRLHLTRIGLSLYHIAPPAHLGQQRMANSKWFFC